MFPSLRMILSGASFVALLLMAAVPGLLSREVGVQGASLGGLQRVLPQPTLGDNPDAQHFHLLAYARRAEELERLAIHPFADEGILHMKDNPAEIVSLRFGHLPTSSTDAVAAETRPVRAEAALPSATITVAAAPTQAAVSVAQPSPSESQAVSAPVTSATVAPALTTPVVTAQPDVAQAPSAQEPARQDQEAKAETAIQAPPQASQVEIPQAITPRTQDRVREAQVQEPRVQEARIQESQVQGSQVQDPRVQEFLVQEARIEPSSVENESTVGKAPAEGTQAQMAALVTRDAEGAPKAVEVFEDARPLAGIVPLPRKAPAVQAKSSLRKTAATAKKPVRVAAVKKAKRVVVRRRPAPAINGPAGTFTPDMQALNQQQR